MAERIPLTELDQQLRVLTLTLESNLEKHKAYLLLGKIEAIRQQETIDLVRAVAERVQARMAQGGDETVDADWWKPENWQPEET